MEFEIGQLKAGNERKSNSSNWKGGKHISSQGYMLVYCPEHPNRNSQGYILEHRLLMEKHLNRFLRREERIHHLNGIKTDNRIENLILFENESSHQSTIPHKYGEFIYKGRKKQYFKNYYLENREKILEQAKTYRKENHELILQKQREKRKKVLFI